MKPRNAQEIAEWRLCVGCGACAYACKDGKITLVDVLSEGIRPRLESSGCVDCSDCVKVCPGYEYSRFPEAGDETIDELREGWGPVLEVWEGYASDTVIRKDGSSGGLATAIALYCLEKDGMHGVLHTGPNPEVTWRNKTCFSHDRADLLSNSGSRYSPASPCDGLDRIESAPSPCVFIGKPCDVAGLRKAQSLKPALNEKTGVAIGIFCAGTPSSNGTLELFKHLKVDPTELTEIRYRGRGWPGMTTVRLKGDIAPSDKMRYDESWEFLQKYRPFRCYLCPDGTSEFADISCGDPWYRELSDDEVGYSLVLVRTELGRRIIQGVMASGYAVLKRARPEVLTASQINLLSKRSSIWGRLLTMKMFFVPAPRYKGFSLFKNWSTLSVKEKVRSVFGTARRIIRRGYYRKVHYDNRFASNVSLPKT
jgi:coenzyme F420 hydrogenase subunit beta